jgi:hypothetical protein
MKIRKNIALSDTGFLFNPLSGDSYSVNEVGGMIIKLIKDNKSEEEIIKAITDEYAIDKDSVEKDFYDFKRILESYKLSE